MESNVKYQPILGRILIKREIRKTTVGGIILPNARNHAKHEGVIVALGETAGWSETYNEQLEKIPVKILNVGDKVIFGKYAGAWLDSTETGGKENDDGTLYICQEADILAVIKEQT